MGRQVGQQLPEFGCHGVVADQKAPGSVLNGARPDGVPQRSRNQRLDCLQPIARLLRKASQMREGGRIQGSLLHRHGVVGAGHVGME